MLRLCDFNSFYSPDGGGVRQYLDRKFEYLAERQDVSYSMIVPGSTSRIEVKGRARRYWVRSPGGSKRRWVANQRELRRILEAERPHVIEVGAPYLSPWLAQLASRGLDARLVGFWHTNYPQDARARSRRLVGAARLREWSAWRYAKITYGRYDAVLAPSEFVANALRRHGVERVFKTPLGVDIGTYSPERRSPNAPGESLVYAGRLARGKGVEAMFDAYPLIRQKHPNCTLTIAGSGSLSSAAERLAADEAGVRYLGFLRDRGEVADLMANSTAVITPGGLETFSSPTAEALSCGVPVVCADNGAAAELVNSSGAGVLFRSGQPRALANAAQTILGWDSAKREEHAARGRSYIVEQHDWPQVFDQQLRTYRRVVGRLPVWS